MPLQRGEVQRYDFDRMTVEFTMLNQGKVIMCAISTAAMDNPTDPWCYDPTISRFSLILTAAGTLPVMLRSREAICQVVTGTAVEPHPFASLGGPAPKRLLA